MQQAVSPFLSFMIANLASVGKISLENLQSLPMIEENFLDYMQEEASVSILPAEKATPFAFPTGQTILSSFLSENMVSHSYSPLEEDTQTGQILQLYPIISQDPHLSEAFFWDKEILTEDNILFSSQEKKDISSGVFQILKERKLPSADITHSEIPKMSLEETFPDLPLEAQAEKNLSFHTSPPYYTPLPYFSKDTKAVFSKIEDILPVEIRSQTVISAPEIQNPINLFVSHKNKKMNSTQNISDFDDAYSYANSPKFQNNLMQIPMLYDNIRLTSDSPLWKAEDANISPLPLKFISQQENLSEHSLGTEADFTMEEKDILLCGDNTILPIDNQVVALQSDNIPQKTVLKEDMSPSHNILLPALLPQEDMIFVPMEEKNVSSEELPKIKEIKEDNLLSDEATENIIYSFIPIQADVAPKLPVIFDSFENKNILTEKISQFSVSDISLPLLRSKESIPQEKYNFEQGDMIRADNHSYDTIKEQKNLPADEKDMGMQGITEFLKRNDSSIDFKDDNDTPIELNNILLHDKTIEVETSHTDMPLLESEGVFSLDNKDLIIDTTDKIKKDKDVSFNNSVSKNDNMIVADRIFSIPEKPEDIVSNPFTATPLSVSESHKTKDNVISTHFPLEKGIILHVTHFKDRPEQIGINLEPAGLGKAELIIENHDNIVTAIIRSDKIEVLDLIRKEAPSLERHLNNSGLNLSGGSLRFEQGGGQGQHSHHPPSSVPQTVIPVPLPLSTTILQNDISQTLYQKLARVTVDGGMDMRL